MRTLLISLLTALTVITPSAASAMSAQDFEADTHVAVNYRAGKLDQKIVENYTKRDGSFDKAGWTANHRELRAYAVCALEPGDCKAAPYTVR